MENSAGRKIGHVSVPLAGLIFISFAVVAVAIAPSHPALIVQKSLVANDRDWQAQDLYGYEEHDIRSNVDADGHAKIDRSKKYQVLMIEGSPYRQLIAVDNEPLNVAQRSIEEAKLVREVARRRAEGSADRRKRVGKYQEQRSEEHLLMQQMASAFHFRVINEEQVAGVLCFRLDATPRSDYVPPVEKARVLTGMRGTLWIAKTDYHWVKVQAEVTQPVSFGFFIAKVNPGTRFELEQMPVDSYWLPKHFVETVNASVFGLYGYRTQDETFYSDYRPNAVNAKLRAGLQ